MINEVFSETKEKMNKVIAHFTNEISVIRTGRASTTILDSVKVDYYGSPTPINNIANVTSPSPDLIVIQPFDPTSLELIENTVDWSLEDDSLLSIRSRGHFATTLAPLTDSDKNFWEIINYVFAIFGLLTLFFFYRYLQSQSLRRYKTAMNQQ